MKCIGELCCALDFLGPVLKTSVEVHCSVFLFFTRTQLASAVVRLCGAQCISR